MIAIVVKKKKKKMGKIQLPHSQLKESGPLVHALSLATMLIAAC